MLQLICTTTVMAIEISMGRLTDIVQLIKSLFIFFKTSHDNLVKWALPGLLYISGSVVSMFDILGSSLHL